MDDGDSETLYKAKNKKYMRRSRNRNYVDQEESEFNGGGQSF
jgi:hypothetical protein